MLFRLKCAKTNTFLIRDEITAYKQRILMKLALRICNLNPNGFVWQAVRPWRFSLTLGRYA